MEFVCCLQDVKLAPWMLARQSFGFLHGRRFGVVSEARYVAVLRPHAPEVSRFDDEGGLVAHAASASTISRSTIVNFILEGLSVRNGRSSA